MCNSIGSAFIARFNRPLPLTVLDNIRNSLLSSTRGRQCGLVTTVDYSARDNDGIAKPPNQSLYDREACPISNPCVTQNFAAKWNVLQLLCGKLENIAVRQLKKHF